MPALGIPHLSRGAPPPRALPEKPAFAPQPSWLYPQKSRKSGRKWAWISRSAVQGFSEFSGQAAKVFFLFFSRAFRIKKAFFALLQADFFDL
jgi:hypothetical protein